MFAATYTQRHGQVLLADHPPQLQQLLLLCFLDLTVMGERRMELDGKSGRKVETYNHE